MTRKTLTLKRPTLTLRKKEPVPKPKKKNKPRKNKKPTTIRMADEPCVSKVHRADKYLSETYQVWADYLPLEIGMHHNFQHLREKFRIMNISAGAIKIVFNNHRFSTRYLQNVIDMEHRYNLDGEITSTITAEEKAYSERKLKRVLVETNT